jgi:hypothetical protein
MVHPRKFPLNPRAAPGTKRSYRLVVLFGVVAVVSVVMVDNVLNVANLPKADFTSLPELVVDGEVILPKKLESKFWYGNPLNGDVYVSYERARPHNQRAESASDDDRVATPFANDTDAFYTTGPDHRAGENAVLTFPTDDIVGMDATTGTFEYWNDENKARLMIKKVDNNKGNSKQSANGLWLQKLALLQAPPADGASPQ